MSCIGLLRLCLAMTVNGELEVVLTEIPNDGERNLIGKVKDEDLGLLDFIKPGQHFKFIK